MKHKPNIIKVAVEAAGGRNRVAELFGVHPQQVSRWQQHNRMPIAHIRPLSKAGGGLIRPERILAYIEKNATEKPPGALAA